MNARLFNSLTEGDFGNGLHLCQSLVEGDFWTRRQGCYAVYRGSGQIDNIDYERILATKTTKGPLNLPAHIEHERSTDYYYAVRYACGTGQQELGTLAVVRLSLDGDGRQRAPQPNQVCDLYAEAVNDGKIRIGWWYWPLGQRVQPDHFSVFGDGGSGSIDYETPLATFEYQGAGFYSYLSEAGNDQQTYRFSVRAVAAGDSDDGSTAYVATVVDLSGPAGIEGLSSDVKL